MREGYSCMDSSLQLVWTRSRRPSRVLRRNYDGVKMPLPNAQKESPRVYKILKIKTLDSEAPNSLTQAEIASVGNPLSVEELNEDELRRLVLVNLARLTCKQEWAGLLG